MDHELLQLMIKKSSFSKVVKSSMECELFLNVLTCWYEKLQNIHKQPMSTTIVQT
jgi:hypothetical protein